MSDAREMPSASVDDVMGWNPCWIRAYGYADARWRIAELWGDRERLTVLEIADLPIHQTESGWVVRETILAAIRRGQHAEFVAAIKEATLAECTTPDFEEACGMCMARAIKSVYAADLTPTP